VGVIGDPVAHSLSPAMHNAAFAELGLDMVYVPLHVAEPSVGEAVRGLRALGFRGANVTMPHKAAVIAHLDRVADEARLIAAVNTIVVGEDGLVGHNTDIPGFSRALAEVVTEGVAGARALLLGAGGAGRAAAFALAGESVAQITVVDLTSERAAAVAGLLREAGRRVETTALTIGRVTASTVARADLVVNATPLGMPGAGKVPAVVADNIGRDHIVYDVVYGTRPTQLLEMARDRGARVVDGFAMLVWQAALAFELWTGRPAPLEAMRRAVR